MTREKLLDGLAESAKTHQVMKVMATISCHDCYEKMHGIGDTDYDAAVTAARVAAGKGWKFKEKTGGVFCRKCWPKTRYAKRRCYCPSCKRELQPHPQDDSAQISCENRCLGCGHIFTYPIISHWLAGQQRINPTSAATTIL